MKLSPLQLLGYAVLEFSILANEKFDPEKDCNKAFEQFTVDVVFERQKARDDAGRHHWSAELKISQGIKDEVNFPYQFNLTLVGMFTCVEGVIPNEKEEQFVRVNGSSTLYGAAREFIRSTTTLGPWSELILPTVSFYDNDPHETQQEPAVSKTD